MSRPDLADAGVLDLVGDLADRAVQRVDRDQADRGVGRAVAGGRDIALTDIGSQLHVERRAVVEVAQHQVEVGDFNVARGGDLAGGDFVAEPRLLREPRFGTSILLTQLP